MKINQLHSPKNLHLEKVLQRKKTESGFALVATISVMVLLVMIALAMLSLSTLETRSAQASDAREEAKANARMALMLAIGELQKYAGLDQRVTAEADIISQEGFYKKDRHLDRRHYLGVYSTEEWNERDRNGIRASWKKYDDNRNRDAFQRWLVSGKPEERSLLNFVEDSVSGADSIEMVGLGTVGVDKGGGQREANHSSDIVRVPFDEITDDKGRVSGRLAWWVGDQGVKARVNLPDVRRDTANKERTNRANRVNPVQMGMENVDGFQAIGIDPTDEAQQEELQRVISYAQTGLFNNSAVSDEAIRSRYHDVTTYSRGVLADVARGGLKRDLSIAFELPDIPPAPNAQDRDYSLTRSERPEDRDTSYDTIYEFSNSGDQRSQWVQSDYWPPNFRPNWWAKRVGYVFSYPAGSGKDQTEKVKYLRGTTWDMLRSYYRLYKREYETLDRTDPDRQNVRAPDDQRTWLARSYLPYSSLTASGGQTVLHRTYVGEFGGFPGTGVHAATPTASNSLLDPFFSYAKAVSEGSRLWSSKNFDTLGLSPVVTRVTLVFGVFGRVDENNETRFDRLHFTVDGVGTVWNPYNVPIQAEALFSNVDLSGLQMVAKGDTLSSEVNLSAFNTVRIGVTEDHPSGHDFSVAPGINTSIRLNPGEVRTFAMNFPEPKDYFDGTSIAPGAFVANDWKGGYFGYWPRTLPVQDKINVTFTPVYQANAQLGYPSDRRQLGLQNYLGFFYNTKGQFTNPMQNKTNLVDLPNISGVAISESGLGNQVAEDILVGKGKDRKTPFMAVDFRLKASDNMGNNGIAREFDPRAIVSHSKVQGGGVPENWEVTINKVRDWSQIQSAGAGDRHNGFWGTTHEGGGEQHIVYFEVPDAPIASIGSLQHCQTSPAAWDQPYAIGGSFAPKRVKQDEVIKLETEEGFEYAYSDNSYLLNSSLWDRYYFSGFTLDDLTITDQNSLEKSEQVMEKFLDPDEENPLVNRRLSLGGHTGGNPPLDEMTHYRWLARHLMLDGAFNINSTRVEAWKAWLSSLKGTEMDVVIPKSGDLTKESTTDTPFSRMVVAGDKEGTEWRGYVNLTDREISDLAENIVEEVRKRGPFLSVADFVNRRLTSGKTGEEGALQAALRASSLDIGSGAQEGIPGTLRQGDILAGLGACITARSDTFVVRAYGDALDPKGKVLARAWCEAVVQRIPTPVGDTGVLLDAPNPDFSDDAFPLGDDPSRTDAFVKNPEASEAAKEYGRQFRVISFRWLGKDEV